MESRFHQLDEAAVKQGLFSQFIESAEHIALGKVFWLEDIVAKHEKVEVDRHNAKSPDFGSAICTKLKVLERSTDCFG